MNKSKLNFLIDLFAKITTVSFIFSSIYIFIFAGLETAFSVKYVWGILGESFILSVAYLPFVTEKEMPRKKYLICNILYFIFADLVVLGLGLYMGWFSLKRPATFIGMEINFVSVFVVVWAIMYLSAKNSATKMNEQLKKLKQS